MLAKHDPINQIKRENILHRQKLSTIQYENRTIRGIINNRSINKFTL